MNFWALPSFTSISETSESSVDGISCRLSLEDEEWALGPDSDLLSSEASVVVCEVSDPLVGVSGSLKPSAIPCYKTEYALRRN